MAVRIRMKRMGRLGLAPVVFPYFPQKHRDLFARLCAHRDPVFDTIHFHDDTLRLVADHGIVVPHFLNRLAVAGLARVHHTDAIKGPVLATHAFHPNAYCHVALSVVKG